MKLPQQISPLFIIGYCVAILLISGIIIQQIEITELRNENLILKNNFDSAISELNNQHLQIKIIDGRIFGQRNFSIFLGDSITSGGNWTGLFPNELLLNDGVSGDTTSGILNRTDNVISEYPDKLFLMVGINDLKEGRNSSAITADYGNILKIFNIKSPKTEIYIFSVLPINRTMYNNAYPNLPKINNDQVMDLNKKLQQLPKEYSNVTYLDIYPLFVDNSGELNANFTDDGLHLNGWGYLLWKNIIQSV